MWYIAHLVSGTFATLIIAQFKDRYMALHHSGASSSKTVVLAAKPRINKLLQELSDDEDDDSLDTRPRVSEDPSRPWLPKFQAYLDTTENVPDDWTAIQWWGVSPLLCSECCRGNCVPRSMLTDTQSGHP
jgi:hypothetical protein